MRFRSFLSLALFGISSTVRADDSALTAAGGNVWPMAAHPTVRMVSEEVHAKIKTGDVVATFHFENDGPAMDVLMGFPEQGYGEGIKRTHFAYFHSFVDGKPINVRRVVAPASSRRPDSYDYWWVKRVHFDLGQCRDVVCKYRGGLGSHGNDRYFTYILKTGANWRGRIGRARVVFDMNGIEDTSDLNIDPPNVIRHGNLLVWDLRDFKPKHDISVAWTDGFTNIRVNGKRIVESDDEQVQPSFDTYADPPERVGREVRYSLERVALWLHANAAKGNANSVEVDTKTRSATIRIGSRRIETDRGVVYSTNRASRAKYDVTVDVGALTRALGGTARWRSDGCLELRLR